MSNEIDLKDRLHICYPSADGSLCILQVGIKCELLILCTRTNEIIFRSSSFHEFQNKLYDITPRNVCDFSPDNTKFAIGLRNKIYIYEFATLKLTKYAMFADLDNFHFLKFLDNKTLVFIRRGSIFTKNIVCEGEKPDTERTIDKKWIYVSDHLLYLNRKDRAILGLGNNSDPELKDKPNDYPLQTKLLSIDGSVNEGPQIPEIGRNAYPTFDDCSGFILSWSPPGFSRKITFMDLAKYISDGIFTVHNDCIKKTWSIYGRPVIPIKISLSFCGFTAQVGSKSVMNYIFGNEDVIYTRITVGYNSQINHIKKADFSCFKLSSLIGSGLKAEGIWARFLKQGLYDPRLFVIIWEFATDW